MTDKTKKVTMVTDQTGADGEALKKGKTYDLPVASADHWLKRNHAVPHGAPAEEASDDSAVELDSMTKDQLIAELDRQGVEHDPRATKADLRALFG